jgi:hypothetical protein
MGANALLGYRECVDLEGDMTDRCVVVCVCVCVCVSILV